jgi:light-regulated signal transduction histidine kinase (bacteriophytochrome)
MADCQRGELPSQTGQDFAALAAHELVKPVILAEACATSLLQRADDRLDDGAIAELKMLVRVCAQARILIDTLLAEAQRRHVAIEFRPVDLALVVRQCLAVLAPEIEARRAHVELAPLPVVAGDAVLLGAVFSNLLVNALQHGARGAQIRVSAEPSDAGWTIVVDSPGRPIPAEQRERLFGTPVPGGAARRARGTGLGLILVRRIVERHGGQIGVTSPDARTNRFYLTLPAASGQAASSRSR